MAIAELHRDNTLPRSYYCQHYLHKKCKTEDCPCECHPSNQNPKPLSISNFLNLLIQSRQLEMRQKWIRMSKERRPKKIRTKLPLDEVKRRGYEYHYNYLKRNGAKMHMSGYMYEIALWTWSQKVRQASNHQCQICGQPAQHAHHILPKNRYPELSLNLNNGIALCQKCHFEFHKLNGK